MEGSFKMSETAESLFRRGAISSKQAGKMRVGDLPKVLKKTKVERASEEDFDGKQGLKDQGGLRDRGIKETSRDAINKNQRDSSAIGGRPSKDGYVRNGKGGTPDVGEINQGGNQRPDFPSSAGLGSKASRGGRDDTGGYAGDRTPNKSGSLKIDRRDKAEKGPSNKRSAKKADKQGGWYGGGGQDTQ